MGTADKATGTSPGVAALAGATPFGSAAPTTPLAAGCSTRKGLADIAGLFVVRKRQLVTGRLSDSEASGEVAEAATPGGHVTVKGQGDDVTKTSVESQTKENPFDCLKAEESDFLFTTQQIYSLAMRASEPKAPVPLLRTIFLHGVVLGSVAAVALKILWRIFCFLFIS